MTSAELESFVASKLADLSQPRAPASLLPRVLAQIARPRREPWHRRPWHSWPAALQATGVAACLVVAWLAASAWAVFSAAEIPAVIGACMVVLRLAAEAGAGYLAALMGLMGGTSVLIIVALSRLLGEGNLDHEIV